MDIWCDNEPCGHYHQAIPADDLVVPVESVSCGDCMEYSLVQVPDGES